jgi:hypothetical protein
VDKHTQEELRGLVEDKWDLWTAIQELQGTVAAQRGRIKTLEAQVDFCLQRLALLFPKDTEAHNEILGYRVER